MTVDFNCTLFILYLFNSFHTVVTVKHIYTLTTVNLGKKQHYQKLKKISNSNTFFKNINLFNSNILKVFLKIAKTKHSAVLCSLKLARTYY